ncbi:MAG: hypothetical protein GF384_09235, partial [Elusimicrobia bacterium]|nr:hypothetical protein [Elusimicrobiota bacterium]
MIQRIVGSMMLVMMLCVSLPAQQITMNASVNKNTVVLGESVTLTVTVSGDTTSVPNPTIPPMPSLQVHSSGRSQSISFVNGKVSSSVSFTYVIMPQTPGKHTIQPVTITLGGKVYETSPILIEAVKQASQKTQSQPEKPSVKQERMSATQSQKNYFITAELDKSTVYVGEPVTYIFKFYRRVRLAGDSYLNLPDLVGFIKEDLPPQKNYYADTQGVRFMVTENRIALFPTSAGKFTLKPAELKITVPVSRGRDPFFDDDFFGGFFGM